MKKLLFLAIAMSIVLISTSVKGQDPQTDSKNDEETAITVKEIKKTVEELKLKWPTISGFINLRYQYDEAADDANGFDLRRARLDLRGDISSSFDYRLQAELAGSPKVLDAYFRWKVNHLFNLQVGQFKIPFSLENVYGPTNLETIDNSLVITSLCGYKDVSGISANGRDIGISVYGGFLRREGFSIISYYLGIFNGAGINTKDDNKSKDFSGILTFNPIKPLSIAVSHYNGSAGPKDKSQQRVRTGVGVKYDDKKLLIRSEYIHGKTGAIESEGAYITTGYFVHPKVQPILKYDYLKLNLSNNDTQQQNLVAGLNFLPIKNVLLQFNYTYSIMSAGENVSYAAVQLFGIF